MRCGSIRSSVCQAARRMIDGNWAGSQADQAPVGSEWARLCVGSHVQGGHQTEAEHKRSWMFRMSEWGTTSPGGAPSGDLKTGRKVTTGLNVGHQVCGAFDVVGVVGPQSSLSATSPWPRAQACSGGPYQGDLLDVHGRCLISKRTGVHEGLVLWQWLEEQGETRNMSNETL